MIIPGNDVKSFCRSALLSAMQEQQGGGGGGGGEGGNIPPDPTEWEYPADWIQLDTPGQYEACLVYGFADGDEKSMYFTIRRPADAIYTDYNDTYCVIDWGDGNVQEINYYTNQDTAQNTIDKRYYKISHTYTEAGQMADGKEQYKIKINFVPLYADNSQLSGHAAALFPFGKASSSGVLTCSFGQYFPRWSFTSSSGLTGLLDRHNTIKYLRVYEFGTYDTTGINPGSSHTCSSLEQIDIDTDVAGKSIYASECTSLRLIKINGKTDMIFDGVSTLSLRRDAAITKIIVKNYGGSPQLVTSFLAGMTGLLYVSLPYDRFYILPVGHMEAHLI